MTPEQRDRAERAQDYWIATVRPDPAGHVVPVWAVLLDDVFYIGTESRSQKIRNLRAHPRAALALPDTTHPLIFEGATTLIETPVSHVINDAFLSKYNWDVNGDPGYIVIALTPDKVISW